MLKFKDYLLLEKVLTYSDSFYDVLDKIESDLSVYLKSLDGDDIDNLVQTDIDINTDKKDSIKFGSNQEMKVGRFIKTVLKLNKIEEFKDTDIENFVKSYKAIMDRTDLKFEILSGSDILTGYDSDNYSSASYSELGESCMNDRFDYLDIYTNNKNIELLVVKEYNIEYDAYEIVGRALIWNTTKGFKFMDRIYFTHSHYLLKMQQWAKSNGIYHKYENKSTANNFTIISPKGERMFGNMIVELDHDVDTYSSFPYMDSFCYGSGNHLYIDKDGLISYYEFKSTQGDYEFTNNGVEDINGDYVAEDDCEWSKYHHAYIKKDDDKLTVLNYRTTPFDRVIDYIYDIENNNDFVYCNIDNKWYFKKDCEWSNFSNTYVMKYSAHYIMKDWVHTSRMKEFYDANPDLKNPFNK